MIEAMGGSLEIKAHFPQGDVTITNYTDTPWVITFIVKAIVKALGKTIDKKIGIGLSYKSVLL